MTVTIEQVEQAQKNYLGTLYERLSKENVEVLDKYFNRRVKTSYFRGKKASLRKVASYFLLTRGEWLEYRYTTSSEILGEWLGKDLTGIGDGSFHLDFSTPILVIHHLKYSMPNKALEILICQHVAERENRGLVTIILDEGNLKDVKEAMRTSDLYVHTARVDTELE